MFSFSSISQEKLAIVLSGGGAKGVAHIPFLKVLDSLQVVPDLIVGNSMGSVVGGLYAMGYPADSIEMLAKTIDWDKILTNSIDYNYINPSERSETDKYSLNIPIKKGKVTLPSGLIESQELNLLLTSLAIKVNDIQDFDDLPIPFRAVATDVVNGTVKVISKGDIVNAIRASMAIPTIFTPVEYDGTLLVDGGVLNNFPVDVAKDLGATIIIGSDVSGGLQPREQLVSFVEILTQTAMISSNVGNRKNRELCDLLLDHVPNLTYSTSDFKKSPLIFEQGKIAVEAKMDSLVSILTPFIGKSQLVRSYKEPKIVFDSIIYKGISIPHENLIQQRIGLDRKNRFSVAEFEDDLRYTYGSTLFESIHYRSFESKDLSKLVFNAKERPDFMLRGSIHYDTERGAGIILNGTFRDLLGKNSRSLITLDAAENPKIRVQHQGYLSNALWWYRLEYFYESIVQNSYLNGTDFGSFNFNYQEINASINRDFGNNNTLSFGYIRNDDGLTPEIKAQRLNIPRDSLTFYFDNYRLSSNGVGLYFNRNTLNKRFFPTKGTRLQIVSQYNFTNQLRINFYSDQLQNIDSSAGQSFIINSNLTQNFELNKKLTLQGNIYIGTQIANDDLYYDYAVPRWYFLGGLEQRPGNQFVLFTGYRDGEYPVTQVVTTRMDLQYNPIGNLYVIPSVNLAIFGQGRLGDYLSDFTAFEFDQESDSEAYWGATAGLNLACFTPIGPIQFLVSKANNLDFARFYISLGFHFQ